MPQHLVPAMVALIYILAVLNNSQYENLHGSNIHSIGVQFSILFHALNPFLHFSNFGFFVFSLLQNLEEIIILDIIIHIWFLIIFQSLRNVLI